MLRALRESADAGWPYPKHPAVWVPFEGEFAFVGAPPSLRRTGRGRGHGRKATDGHGAPADHD